MTTCQPFLRVQGEALMLGGSPAPFLNGLNIAWIRWQDFALNTTADPGAAATYCGMEDAMRFLVHHGGNAVRVWVFTEPEQQLRWASDGRVAGLADGVLITALTLLDLALHYGVNVVLVLFNGALARDERACSLFDSSAAATDALLRHAVRPLAAALRGHEALAMWEVANEIEGLLDTSLDDTSPALADATLDGGQRLESSCVDTSSLEACSGRFDGPGWNERCKFSMGQVR